MSKFILGDIVKVRNSSDPSRQDGVIQHLTCAGATAKGGKICKPSSCNHPNKDRIWVKWANDQLCSYLVNELEHDNQAEERIMDEIAQRIESTNPDEAAEAVLALRSLIKSKRHRQEHNHNEPQVARTGDQKMSSGKPVETKSLGSMIKSDGTKAAYRVAARKINQGVQTSLVGLLKSKGANNSQIEGIAMFLSTDFGEALLATVSGHALTHIPVVSKDPRAQKLAEEFRVGGLATAGNKVVGLLTDQLKPLLENALSKLPAEETAQETETASARVSKSREIKGAPSEEIECEWGEEEQEDETDQSLLQAVSQK